MVRGGLQSLNINPRLSINLERGWSLNKGTGTNQIISQPDLNTSKLSGKFNTGGLPPNLCLTKTELTTRLKSGYSLSLSGYASNQLVKYSDVNPESLLNHYQVDTSDTKGIQFVGYNSNGGNYSWSTDLGMYTLDTELNQVQLLLGGSRSSMAEITLYVMNANGGQWTYGCTINGMDTSSYTFMNSGHVEVLITLGGIYTSAYLYTE